MTYKIFVKRLFGYLKPHLLKLIIASIAMVFATVLESSIPEITGRIVDDLFIENRSESTTFIYSIGLFLIFICVSIFTLISVAVGSSVSNTVIMNLRVEMFKKLNKLPKKFFDDNSSGNLLSKLTFDVEQLAGVASTIWIEFLKSFITLLVLSVYLFFKSFALSLLLVVILPIIFYAIKISSKRMRNSSKEVQDSVGNMTHMLDENISGNSIIKIYQAEKDQNNKFIDLVKNIRQQRFKVDLVASLNTNLINALLGLSLASVVYFSSINLNMTAGEFLSYFTALAMLIKPAKTLVNINRPMQIALTAGRSVFKLLDEKEEVDEGTEKISAIKGEIKFKNVSFSYNEKKLVLKKINFTIPHGKTVAIVGATGSGKTSITNLIAKFYKPSSGNIYIDNIDINAISNTSLRKNISFVDQKIRLFNESISSNIALGKKENLSLREIRAAAESSNSIEFIEKLDNKFDTIIGDDGKLLSGGQRQRLAIARAIAKDAPILILDEATSALDSSTERLVQNAISQMSINRTTIVIAHRLSTVKKSDKIIVLNDGKIIEEGNHEELIKLGGYYKKLIDDQFK